MIWRVGQKVRYVAKALPQHQTPQYIRTMPRVPIGSELVIESIPGVYIRGTTIISDCSCSYSGIGYAVMFYQIEPIQPERNRIVSWNECVWRPEHFRGKVV